MMREPGLPSSKPLTRVRIRSENGRFGGIRRISGKMAAGILFGSALGGALLGWLIGQIINRALEIHRSREPASVSWSASSAAAPRSTPGSKSRSPLPAVLPSPPP